MTTPDNCLHFFPWIRATEQSSAKRASEEFHALVFVRMERSKDLGVWSRYANCTFDHNLYYSTNLSSSPIDFPPPGPRGGTGKRISPAAWQGLGKDKHSLFGVDPLFVNASNMDFRLQSSSPALKQIGFEPWNYSDVGPIGLVGVAKL